MDKYEHKVRLDEIENLIQEGDFVQAAEIADTIDWRKVNSVKKLCTGSDVYKINRRYENAKDLLLLAYERRPGGRTICYSLCELCIKTGDLVQAMEYYKEFVNVAPRDPARYILQYKLYEDQDVSLEERIEVLEELKKYDYREKWAYELAYLYHRVGLATRCVEECDEMILWFGDGKYVIKAMELKMLHQPLTPEQQEIYDRRFEAKSAGGEESAAGSPEGVSADSDTDTPGGDTMIWKKEEVEEAVGGDTIVYEPVRAELLKALNEAESEEQMDETAEEDYDREEDPAYADNSEGEYSEEGYSKEDYPEEDYVYDGEDPDGDDPAEVAYPAENSGDAEDELDIHVKTMDVGRYNTINLQAELAQELKNLLGEETQEFHPMEQTETIADESDEMPAEDIAGEADHMEEISGEPEVFFGETGEITVEQARSAAEENPRVVMPMNLERKMAEVEPPKEMAGVLSQESDGQIRIVLPEGGAVEKQITGQMDIEDVLAEWERMKRENEAKRKEEVRRHVLQQTGSMFTEFEASVRDGLLEQLEKGEIDDVPGTAEEAAETDEVEELTEIDEESGEIEEESAETGEASEAEEATEIDETSEPAEMIGESGETVEETEDDEAETDEVEELTEIEEESAEIEEEPAETDEIPETDEADETDESDEPTAEDEADREAAAEAEGDGEPENDAEADEEAGTTETEDESAAKKLRSMTREEREHFSAYIQSKSTREQIIRTIDNISLAAYTGNVVITGEVDVDTIPLAKKIIREVQLTDSNFSGQVAKISGQGLNNKNVEETLERLQNGALIIQNASGMNGDTAESLHKALQKESLGIVVLMQDDTKSMNRFLEDFDFLQDAFTARVDVAALSNDMLVAYGKQYAKEREYAIDDLGMLALHNRIEQRQTIDHAVTTAEVKEIVDEAIRHANRKTPGHFMDILFAKRYDDEDMIIVTEKDFI